MKFSVIGGDRRAACLCARLAREGHSVRCFALEKAETPPGVQRAGCLQGCVYGAEWVVLPVPTEKKGALLTPLSSETLDMAQLLPVLWPGQVLVGGRPVSGPGLDRAMVFQDYSLFPWSTCAENIVLALEQARPDLSDRKR